jgi:hypothetical protein
MHVGGGHGDRQRHSQAIDGKVALATFDALATIVTRSPPILPVLMLWPSMTTMLGSRERPAAFRTMKYSLR